MLKSLEMNESSTENPIQKINFIIKFGTALHKLGTNSFRTEAALTKASKILGLKGEFFFTPTYILSSFQTNDGEISRHVRVEPGSVNLEKLVLVDKLADEVMTNQINVEEAQYKLDEIMTSKNRYPEWLTILCHGFVSSSVSTILSQSIQDVFVSFFLGISVGLISFLSSRVEKVKQINEAISAFVVLFLASFISLAFPMTNTKLVVLAGLITIIPGLPLTISLAELATNHLASGTARLMGSLMTLLKISFGVALGVKCTSYLIQPLHYPSVNFLPEWISYLGLLLSGLCFTILFRARPKDVLLVVAASLIGILGSRFGIKYLDPNIGTFFGGLLVGGASNLFARFFNRPAMLIQLPGIILSVPGSIGYKSLTFMFEHNVVLGMSTAFDAVTVAVSLVAGLFFGNLIINPRRVL